MNSIHLIVAETLMGIEKELRELRLWDADMISEEALASDQPFAVDTMSFPQWLQFIFVPRMYFMIEQEAPLPTNCSVAPMAEHYFSDMGLPSSMLIKHLRRIDSLLSQ